jgi:hypothetical protein
MNMSALTRRLHILLDEDRYARLKRVARRRGASIATIVREAIDAAFPDEGPNRSEAARRILDAEPIPVSDWPLLKKEIEQMYEPAAE